ncbi:MAG TPA: hypothetical protein VLC09_19235 [Polyangiaceae bacterium]|nr:hypothetical protein [Polyangiaceae bacterium]
MHVDPTGERTPSEPPEYSRSWIAADDEGCVIEPREDEEALERGPWQRVCP